MNPYDATYCKTLACSRDIGKMIPMINKLVSPGHAVELYTGIKQGIVIGDEISELTIIELRNELDSLLEPYIDYDLEIVELGLKFCIKIIFYTGCAYE